MALVRTLLFLLGAFSVLLLGAVSPASAAPPPCHAMAGMTSETPEPSPERPIKTMGCCIACIAAPALTPPVHGDIAIRVLTPQRAPRVLPAGRRVSPETGPPKA